MAQLHGKQIKNGSINVGGANDKLNPAGLFDMGSHGLRSSYEAVNADDLIKKSLLDALEIALNEATTGIQTSLDDLDLTKLDITLFDAATAGIWAQINTLANIDSIKAPEAYDPTGTSLYPTTYASETITAGDSYRITANGSMGTVNVNVEDLLIALVDSADSATDGDWMVVESNREQATEDFLGLVEKATTGEVTTGTDNLRYITPFLLANKLSSYATSSDLSNAIDGVNTSIGNVATDLSNHIDDFNNATTGINEALDAITATVAVETIETWTATTTASDGDVATSTGLVNDPEGYVSVYVNGVYIKVNGDKLGYCYFSADGGTTAKATTAIATGDVLYWNGTIAGYELDNATDEIVISYEHVA